MASKRGPRPITIAKNIVARMLFIPGGRKLSIRSHTRLLKLLTDDNAASGTTDRKTAERRARTIRRRARK
jgi:hypothetical protein